MIRYLLPAFAYFVLLLLPPVSEAAFDERLWESYAEINPLYGGKDDLAAVYLEPYRLEGLRGKTPFADLRIVTDRKEELPWQVVAKRPEKRREEVPASMRNLSITQEGKTWLELVLEKPGRINAVEIVTSDAGFSRQVEISGSNDGKTWNSLRKDGVIFDITRGERLRHTRIPFSSMSFRYLALSIANGDASPLKIDAVKVFEETDREGETSTVGTVTDAAKIDAARQESSIVVRMNSLFPIDRLVLRTEEKNFQRAVDVQVKSAAGEWQSWAQGTVFSFDGDRMHEAQLAIDLPEIAVSEFRLVFRNLDSPPLAISGVTAESYRRLLVFKQRPDRKLYLFWGNPQANRPEYDLAGIIEKREIDALPVAIPGEPHRNTAFAGNGARLPFSERYRYALYAVVAAVIAGLAYLQFRVIRSTAG